MPLVSGTRTDKKALSANQQAVFDALCGAAEPLSAYDVIALVGSKGISAPPTVYRALNRLIEYGLVHRIESLNAYVACAKGHGHGGPVAFAICTKCGKAREIADRKLASLLSDSASQADFVVETAVVELSGRCGKCVPPEKKAS